MLLAIMTEFRQFTVGWLRKGISHCRVFLRKYNNDLKDAMLDSTHKDVSESCEDQIHVLNEARELHNECDRFIKHYKKNRIAFSQIPKWCCPTPSNENIDPIDQDSTCIKEVMSKTRKFLREYNDHLDDLTFKNEDGRPCEKCKESLLQECQGLTEELKRLNDQFQDKCSCQCACGHVTMRAGARGKYKDRSSTKQHQLDSGIQSVNSEILRREAIESQDNSQAPSADTTFLKDQDKHDHTEAPSSSFDNGDPKCQGPCVTLDVSMDASNTTDD